jgi:hypothetical protein
MLPIARTEGLHVEQLVGEVMVYDTARHKAHCLSPAAAAVWRNCDGESSTYDLCAELRKEGIQADEELVWMILHRLSKLELLKKKVTLPENAILSTRRDLVKKVAMTGGMLLLMTATIGAPTAAQAQSGEGDSSPKKPKPKSRKD